jgi:hypothetical protein
METEEKVDVDKIYLEMFEVFAQMHPHEAYDLHKNLFCDFMRRVVYPGMNDEEIGKMIEETR